MFLRPTTMWLWNINCKLAELPSWLAGPIFFIFSILYEDLRIFKATLLIEYLKKKKCSTNTMDEVSPPHLTKQPITTPAHRCPSYCVPSPNSQQLAVLPYTKSKLIGDLILRMPDTSMSSTNMFGNDGFALTCAKTTEKWLTKSLVNRNHSWTENRIQPERVRNLFVVNPL